MTMNLKHFQKLTILLIIDPGLNNESVKLKRFSAVFVKPPIKIRIIFKKLVKKDKNPRRTGC